MARVLHLLVLLFAGVALAQPVPDPAPKQGGVAKEAGGLVYELKLSPTEILVWVRDDAGKPVPTAGSAAKVTLIPEATLRAEVPLKPAGDNRFRAQGTFAIKPGASAELDVAVGDRPPVKVTFMLK